MVSNVIDLSAEAAKREVRYPDGLIVKFGDDSFTLPAELPVAALDPLFEINIDLATVFGQALALANSSESEAASKGLGIVFDVLTASPNLPKELWEGLRKSLAVLFGDEQWERFESQSLSLATYIALVKGLLRMYGSTLGEAFGSASPSENDGVTSSETSDNGSKSTRAVSGKRPAKKVSSASDGS